MVIIGVAEVVLAWSFKTRFLDFRKRLWTSYFWLIVWGLGVVTMLVRSIEFWAVFWWIYSLKFYGRIYSLGSSFWLTAWPKASLYSKSIWFLITASFESYSSIPAENRSCCLFFCSMPEKFLALFCCISINLTNDCFCVVSEFLCSLLPGFCLINSFWICTG